jgi:minor extracellular serine protease Vpr
VYVFLGGYWQDRLLVFPEYGGGMMHSCRNRVWFRYSLPAVLALAVYGFGTPQNSTRRTRSDGPASMQVLLRYAIPGTRDLQLIVELEEPPVARALAEPAARLQAYRPGFLAGGSRMRLDTQQAIALRNQIARRRQLASDQLQTLSGVEIQGSTDLVLNSIIARVPVEHYLAVRRMPGVKKVYFSRPQRMNLNAAAQTQNAAALWARVYGGRASAGDGQKIGIIDTGIDNSNPMFADTTLPTPSTYPSGFPKYDAGNQSYTNHKVIVARDYIGLLANRQVVQSARDEVGHGSFVAGCAAGKLYSAPKGQISGMAPGALLGSYKIFGTPGINDYTTTAAVLAAINDAVNDGMDVLNLSLGSLDYIPPSEDPEVDAINNAVAAGVVVCLAAGNDGPETRSVNSPGAAPDAITVGAIWNARIFASQLHVAGPSVPANLQTLAYLNGGGPTISTAIPASLALDVATLDGDGLACSALPAGRLTGKIAVVGRGTCTFLTKVTNAASAGARAVVVYDNIPGAALLAMGGLTGTAIPAVAIFYADGMALKDYLSGFATATIDIGVSTSNQLATPVQTVLTSDSSRGPATDFGIKPDLVAVGWSVYSAAQNSNRAGILYDTTRFTVSQGTSFSTPMVTGAAAAVMQLFPDLSPAGVKSVLANTASQITTDGITPATVVQAGNGMLNMGNAAAAGAIFSPTNLNFQAQAYSGSAALTRTLSITNISSGTDQFAVSVQPVISGPVISVSTANTGPLAPGASANIDVSVQAAAPLSGGFQGFVTFQSSRTAATYSIPYWAGLYVSDPSRILTVRQSGTGTDVFQNLADALAAANPGNIIEIADSQTYTLPSPSDPTLPAVTISTNAQGLPLHGITIRAAAGQAPILDGTSANAFADLQVVGLKDVLFQGLTINGGETGIDLIQPSSSIPLSVTIDHCNLTNQNSSVTSSGIVLESGGEVDVTFTTVSGSSSAGVALFGGGQLMMSNSTIQNNGSDGIDGVDANIDLMNSTISNNSGQGTYLVNCTGTITGNTFARNRGIYGDGIQLLDGTMTINGNTFDSNTGAAVSLFAGTITTPTGTGPSPGPVVNVNKNIMHANDYGLLIDQAQNLQMDGNLIADNAQGVQLNGSSTANLTNNIIVRSTDPTFGDGLNAANTSAVRVISCDFHQNRHKGIALTPGASVSVANSILSGNVAGDLAGLSSSSIQYSLIGDGTFASVNNNITGNPMFTDPVANDFSLAAASPAINVGTNAAANLPFLDYNQKFRVAGTGALPGDGVTDMGAIESGSSYPLVYPLMVNGYNATIGDNDSTGIAVMNSSSAPISAAFAGYRPDGTLIPGTSNPSLPPPLNAGAQIPTFGYQLLGLVRAAGEIGGVLASSAQKLTGFFLVFDQDLQRLADGVDVSAETATQFLFLRHQFDTAGKATYVFFNPGVNTATVNATLLDTSGTPVDQLTAPLVLPPKGQSLLTFPNFTASSGTLSVNSDRPIAGLELFGNMAEIAALRAVVPGTEARLFFPHFAVNNGYTSLMGVTNSANEPVNLTLTAYGDDGKAIGTPALRTISAKGQLLESASSLFGLGSGNMITGYAVVEGDKAGITGFSQFNYDYGGVQASAAVPTQSIPRQKLFFSHIAHQVPAVTGGNYLTGIALLNPFGTRISYTLRVFDGAGTQVAEMTDTIAPHAKVSKLLSFPTAGAGYFTQPMPLSSGHIEVTTDYQLLGFELFFTEGLTQLVAVMAQFSN